MDENREIITYRGKLMIRERGKKIWWVDTGDVIGEWLFTFDKKKIYNMFRDYPHALTSEEKAIFDEEEPYWADFFRDRPIGKGKGAK